MTFFRVFLAFACLLAVTFSASAHRLKQATSRVVWQPSDHSLEVTHILHLHDAEQALSAQGLLDRPDLTPLKARALLALYASDHFKLFDLNEEAMDLQTIGAEIVRGRIYIYQEAELPARPDGLIVDNSILLDIYPNQVNMVNVNLSGQIKTLQFEAGDAPKRLKP